MSGLVVVALNGPTPDTALLRARIDGASLFIAADAGAQRLAALGLRPDVLTGDFDSLPAARREAAVRAGAEVVAHPEPQQTTDGAVALRLAVERAGRSRSSCWAPTAASGWTTAWATSWPSSTPRWARCR